MPKTRLTRDDAYEEMASAYQCVQIDALNTALKANGVEDVATRRSICAHFLDAIGSFHDQFWMEAEGRRVHPLLCFSTEFLNVDTDVGDLGDTYTPSDLFSFHEYVSGNIYWYFDEHDQDASEIRIGAIEGGAD